MTQCVVIADDLTGGNATGVQLKQSDFNSISILNSAEVSSMETDDIDCIIYPTDSRAIPQQEAYDRIYEACEKLKGKDTKVYSKRIDSTLRGNIGAETDAMLDSLGADYTAIVVPTFPSSGRTVVGGYLLVNGALLHKTDIAIDPKCPVKVAKVSTIVRQQSKYNITNIYSEDMMNGKHHLADIIKEKISSGNRIIIFDAVTQEDLDLIADAVMTSKQKVLAVDSGAFTAALARKAIKPKNQTAKSHVLVVIGSVHPTTAGQVAKLKIMQRTVSETVVTKEFLESEERREKEISRVVDSIVENYDKFPISTVIGDGLDLKKRIDFKPYMKKLNLSLEEVSAIINDSFAEIAIRIFDRVKSFKGLYCCGGDITVAVCQRVKAAGISLEDEVLPLAAYGFIKGGPLDGCHIVTKGGSQGNQDALIDCVNYLKKRLSI